MRIFLITFYLLAVMPVLGVAERAGGRLFSLHVKPLLAGKCLACHGEDPQKIQAELDLTSRAGLFRGGESGKPSLVPGEPLKSPLYLAATRAHEDAWAAMPPKENDALTKPQLTLLNRWIALGAPWPDPRDQALHIEEERSKPITSEGVMVRTSGGLSDAWTYRRYQPADLWAFRPVLKPRPPEGMDHPIDAFVERKLNAAGFAFAPQADGRTLLRRACYDLTGLPPTPDQAGPFLLAWEKDPGQAWRKLIDTLLVSPHYGERWGQHWLDVVRYADTGGYSNDYERSNAWRYRDYVIRAFNEDKPYDAFILEQIAGDELWEKQSPDKRDPSLQVASGFLRMGPWDPAMVKVKHARQICIDDMVNAVGQTFLGITMRCLKCHDHKFDPLPTRDYYRMYATFAATQLAERPAPFLQEENLAGRGEGRASTQVLLDFATEQYQRLYRKQEDAARAWFARHGKAYLDENDRKGLPDEDKPPRYIGLSPEEQGRLKVRRQDTWIWRRRLERYQPMVQGVYNGATPGFLNARSMRLPNKAVKTTLPKTRILLGGALEAPGEKVVPGVLSALGVPVTNAGSNPYVIPENLHGRRLALAQWIANPKNPLTTRSIVNRVWQHHFGKPLAATPNNFGAKGGKPTHPALLDWLAADFVEHGWTFKRLHRMIMLSATYQQGGMHPKQDLLENVDPGNALLAYHQPRRLTAEEIRDSLLVASGELNPLLGGLPVMPEINMEVALQPRMIQFSLAPAYQPSPTPFDRNRRTIYAYRVRGMTDPFLELFNQPNPNESCEVRDAAVVPPQVFTLLNSQVMSDRAIAMALQVEKQCDTLHQQVCHAVQRAFGRMPGSMEWEELEHYVLSMREYHVRHHPEVVTYPQSIIRSLVEELTGQRFEYKEILPVFENYVSDKKPADVSANTRALADLCLLLFNANEFIYVY
jgi:hypothetical protein